jgi:hypothetical protein
MAWNNYNQNRGGGRPAPRPVRGPAPNRGRGSGDPDRVRLTGLWRVESYETGVMFRGSLRADQVRELRLLLKRAADEGKDVSFALFDNGKPRRREDPRFTLHASVYTPTQRSAPREEPDDYAADDYGEEGEDYEDTQESAPAPERRPSDDRERRPGPPTRNDDLFD